VGVEEALKTLAVINRVAIVLVVRNLVEKERILQEHVIDQLEGSQENKNCFLLN